MTFTTVQAFDYHRVKGKCAPPLTVGLEDVGRATYQCFGFPGEE